MALWFENKDYSIGMRYNQSNFRATVSAVRNRERKHMRQLTGILLLLMIMAATAPAAFAAEGDPLANAVLLSGMVGWAMVGLALLLMVLFIFWTRRGPN